MYSYSEVEIQETVKLSFQINLEFSSRSCVCACKPVCT